jgi:microcin C transport system substrate-binding protein
MYDTLLTSSSDEPTTYYGLLAQTLEFPEDYSWVVFNLREGARWHDGKPVTAYDVVFSYTKLTEVSPFYRNYYNLVEKAEAIDAKTVRFTFKKGEISRELPLIVGQMTVLPKHFWEKRDISKSTLEIPLGSGAYKISSFDAGRRVVFERVKNYWGENLPVNRGFNNFDKLIFDYYRDQTVAFEAFKAGHFDVYSEGSGKNWYRGYTGKYFDMKLIKKAEIPHKNPQGMSGIVMNTGAKHLSNPLFRQALVYAYDFEWVNKQLYFGQEKRHNSYFSNSVYACPEKMPDNVAKLLNSLGYKTKAGETFTLPKTDGSGNNRSQLKTALGLLEKAGYGMKNKKLTDVDGKPVELEIATSSKTIEKELMVFKKSLERLGIDLFIKYMDSSQYVETVRDKKYMMIYTTVKQSLSPGNEQRGMWHSEAAGEKGSRNYAQIKDKTVDALVDMIITAPDGETLLAATRALDRVLMEGYYFIPAGYSDKYRIAFWDKFRRPAKMPEYALGFDSWWILADKEKKIDSLLSK